MSQASDHLNQRTRKGMRRIRGGEVDKPVSPHVDHGGQHTAVGMLEDESAYRFREE
jgi:hypothetical protein